MVSHDGNAAPGGVVAHHLGEEEEGTERGWECKGTLRKEIRVEAKDRDEEWR